MEQVRNKYQGVWNILRFNRHFYVAAAATFLLLLLAAGWVESTTAWYIQIASILIILSVLLSLFVSWYVYDLSGLYTFDWLDEYLIGENKKVLNIHAGFDETSWLLKQKFLPAELIVFDFYDPLKHTEISIQRARKAYPAYPGTRKVQTSCLPIANASIDTVFVILSAHEIREASERDYFFKELDRILHSKGKIIMVEHVRDISNFLAYNVGFFHFLTRSFWKLNFKHAGLLISAEKKINPFITLFILEKYGIAN